MKYIAIQNHCNLSSKADYRPPNEKPILNGQLIPMPIPVQMKYVADFRVYVFATTHI